MKFTLSALLLAFPFFAFSQIDTARAMQNLRVQKGKMDTAFRNGQYLEFAQTMHPNLLKVLNGPENLAKMLETGMASIDNDETRLDREKMSMSDPENLVICEKAMQAIVWQHLEIVMIAEKQRILSGSPLLATSSDGGQTWHFLDIGNKPFSTVKKIEPHVCPEMEKFDNSKKQNVIDEK